MADTGKNTCKFEGLDWAWAQLAKHLLPKHKDMSLIPGEHVKMPGKWVHICNPTLGVTEATEFLGLTGKPRQLYCQVPGQWATLSEKKEITYLRMTLEIVLWALYSHTHVHAHL